MFTVGLLFLYIQHVVHAQAAHGIVWLGQSGKRRYPCTPPVCQAAGWRKLFHPSKRKHSSLLASLSPYPLNSHLGLRDERTSSSEKAHL